MFLIYTKPSCIYCDKAKYLLQEKGLEYEEIKITADNRQELFDEISLLTGRAPTTVPQIFDGDNYIGGFNELDKCLNV